MAGPATPTATPNSGNTWLEGILWNSGWTSGGSTTTIGVYIAGRSGNETVSLVGQTITAQGSISAAEVAAMERAMDAIAAVANVTFVDVPSRRDADIVWASVDNDDGGGALGWANPPGTAYCAACGQYQSAVTVNQDAYSGPLVVGTFDYVTFIHELGHAMGLSHPHDTGGGSTVFPGVSSAFGDYGTYDMNQGIYTMMSYNDGWQTAPHGASPSASYGFQGTPMALDIAALQFLYGANTSTNLGNTTYTLPGTNGLGTHYATIWDAGGTDTIVGNASRANVIDLRAATLLTAPGGGGFVSYATGVHGGFTIANGAVIENATGGMRGDTITGNAAANLLDGLAGADRILGGVGNDTLFGGAGADTLTGGEGADSLAGGADADSLIGGAGNDRLDGGAGGDTFVFEGLFGNDTIAAGDDLSGTNNVIRVGTGVTGAMISYALAGGGAHLLLTVAGQAIGHAGTILLAGWAAAQAAGGGFGAVVWTAGGGGSIDLTSELFARPGDPAGPSNPAGHPLTGSAGNNVLSGTEGSDTIVALGGSDLVRALAGADTVDAGSGHDTVYGGAGDDVVIGGDDNDRLLGDSGDDTIDGGAGADRIYGGAGDDALFGGSHDDRLFGGDGRDVIDGGTGSDRLDGGAGDDTLDGGRADDYILGGEGNDLARGGASTGADRLFGNAGNDTLDGGRGNDRLDGGSGNDLLSGDRGADVYVFSGAFGSDTIVGFDDTTERRQDGLDRIDLTAFRVLNGGVLGMNDLRLTVVGGGVLIQLDLDSNGVADVRDLDGDGNVDVASILIIGATVGSLSSHDFVF